jgi:hypothetical protein
VTEESSAAVRTLESEVRDFAGRLSGTLTAALNQEVEFTVDVARNRDGVQNVSIYPTDENGVLLTVDARPTFRLVVSYECRWNESQKYFGVTDSSFTVFFDGSPEPLFHFDYRRDSVNTVPTAHLNVHAHRDEIVHALLRASKKRGKARRKQVEAGELTGLAEVHLPVGGPRFRPSVEDVLEMLILEFGVDADPGVMPILRAARAEYRTTQLKAAVTDHPEAAASALRELGYDVVPPQPSPPIRSEKLQRY